MSPSAPNDFTSPPQPPKHRISGWIIGPVLAVLLAAGVLGFMGYSFLFSAPEKTGKNVEILISQGMPFNTLVKQLKEKNTITNERYFELLARYLDSTGKIKSGRYLVNTGWTPTQVLDQIINGTPVLDRITLPEGLTWWEVGKRLEEAGFVRFDDFKTVIHDPTFLRHYGIRAPNAEGYLFPDTYLIMRPLELNEVSARQVTGRLLDNFWRRVQAVWPDSKKATNSQMLRYTLSLASIIEKETAISTERARVSGVYTNRLQRNMLLQADPTIIYGVGPSFTGSIRRSQLDDASNTYNTYKHPGLPPGPICSPGLASIKAARNPEEHPYLFFVARGDGSHSFSATLNEHNRAVKIYRDTLQQGDNPTLLPGGGTKDRPRGE